MHFYLSLFAYYYHFQLVWPNCPVVNKLTEWTHPDKPTFKKTAIFTMEQYCTLRNVKNYLNTNIYSYLETSGSQSYNLYLNVIPFFNTSLN